MTAKQTDMELPSPFMMNILIFHSNPTLNLPSTGWNSTPESLLINALQVHACPQLHPIPDDDSPRGVAWL